MIEVQCYRACIFPTHVELQLAAQVFPFFQTDYGNVDKTSQCSRIHIANVFLQLCGEGRTVLGKLHVAGKSPEITCENAGNPRKIAADTRNSVGDATGKALSAAEITCETARKSAKGKSMESEADSRVDSETDARSALPISKSSSKLTETDHAWTKRTDYND